MKLVQWVSWEERRREGKTDYACDPNTKCSKERYLLGQDNDVFFYEFGSCFSTLAVILVSDFCACDVRLKLFLLLIDFI